MPNKSNNYEAVFARIKGLGIDTQEKLAMALGIKQQTISVIKKRGKFPEKWAFKIAQKYHSSTDYLLTGEGSMRRGEAVRDADNEFIGIPMVRGRISAGGGLEPDNTIELRLSFRADWVKRKGDPARMSIIRVYGDSMEPTLESGDLVLIDHGKDYVDAQGGIYALAVDGEIMLKRVQIVRSAGQARIISDNPKYEVEVVPADKLVVNGKAIWYGREMER